MNLEEVRTFVASVEKAAGSSSIKALVLNAGGYAHARTAEGYEATFVTNYLAHYLLLRLLWERVSIGGIVVLTTSGTHDPEERTVVPPPRHANALWLAKPELDPNLDHQPRTSMGRAYSSSKLCLLLMARALATHVETQYRKIRVIGYDPGPAPGTGLVREQGLLVRLLWGPLAFPLRLLMPKANTIEDAGATLADIALGRICPPEGKVYAAVGRGKLTWPNPSELARRDDLMTALWRDSAQLVGLPD